MQQYLKRQTAVANNTSMATSSSSIKSRDAHSHSMSSGNYSSSIEGLVSGGGGGGSQRAHNTETYTKYSKSSHEFPYDDDDMEDNSSSAHASNLLDVISYFDFKFLFILYITIFQCCS